MSTYKDHFENLKACVSISPRKFVIETCYDFKRPLYESESRATYSGRPCIKLAKWIF